MKNHRRLANSPLLKISMIAVIALCLIPVLPALAMPHGIGGLAAAGMLGMTTFRFAEATDPANPDAVGIPDAIKAIEDKTLLMSQRLGVALKVLQGIDPTGQLATIKADLDKAKTDLTARDGDITKLKADLDAANKRITAMEADVKTHDEDRAKAEKEAADLRAKEQDLEKRAAARANEKIAALGFSSSKLPAATDKPAGGAYADALEEYAKITDPLKAAAFYAASVQPLINKRGTGLN